MKKIVWSLALVTSLVGCSSKERAAPTPTGDPELAPVIANTLPPLAEEPPAEEPPAGTMTARVVDRQASFAALESPAIRSEIMRLIPPQTSDAVEDPAPPLSLTASDGTGLELVSLEASAVIDGPVAFTELHMQFRNPRDRVIEGRFSITLPSGATVSRLAMRLDTGWQEAEVVERQLARRAYEDFLHRRQDPALLEKQAGNEFGARIFPIPARGTKEIILSFSQSLVGRDAMYRLPLRGLPEIAELRVKAMVGEGGAAGQAMSYRVQLMEEKGYVPTSDFEVAIPAAITGLRHGEHVAARLRPELSVTAQPLGGLLVLFDTSASRALGFGRQVSHLGRLMEALAATQGGDTPLVVATFDQVIVPVHDGTLADFGRAELDAIRAHRPLGASNLHAALTWAGERKGSSASCWSPTASPPPGPSIALGCALRPGSWRQAMSGWTSSCPAAFATTRPLAGWCAAHCRATAWCSTLASRSMSRLDGSVRPRSRGSPCGSLAPSGCGPRGSTACSRAMRSWCSPVWRRTGWQRARR